MQIEKGEVLTIDGTRASGKGTESELVAEQLNFLVLDSGSLYRTLGLLALRGSIDPEDPHKVNSLVDASLHRLSMVEGKVLLDGEPVQGEIRTPEVARITPVISRNPYLRKALLPLQRGCAGPKGLVAEGRDMGEVFAGARLKIFLTADEEIRAGRRHAQYIKANQRLSFSEVLEDLKRCDKLDRERPDSPLVCTPEKYSIDTSFYTPEEVARQIVLLWRETFRKAA